MLEVLEATPGVCDLAERCHAQAVAVGDPIILGDNLYDAQKRFIGGVFDALEQDIEWLDGLIAAERRLMTGTGGTRSRSLRRKERLT